MAVTCVRASVWCVEEGEARSVRSRWCCGYRPPRRGGWRVACAREEYHYAVDDEWRRACGELRVEMRELQSAVADAWMQDEMHLLELQKLASLLVASYHAQHAPAVTNSADAIANPDHDGADVVTVSELRSEEIRAKQQEGLSTLRRLKTLNVHEYVHSALRASHLRSWLRSRGVAE